MSSFAQQQKNKEIKQCALELTTLSKTESNRNCADCGHKPARWVSLTFGCWLCSKCAGIHRGLGVHISFVKSSTLDNWNYELLNKFKSLGGNLRVNEIYEAKLKKRDKINHGTNEYKAIEFITQKYVEKKWMRKDQQNHDKKKKKSDKRKLESKSKKYQQRQKPKKQQKLKRGKKDKDIMINSDEGKIEPVPDLLNFHQDHEEEHKKYEDDKPSDWVKFTENEGEIVHIEDGDNMMPSLLDLNEMERFAFSDLASFKAQNGVDLIDVIDKDIMDNNNNNNSNKMAILSMYNADYNGNFNANMVNYNAMNPMIRMNSSSPFPKREIMPNNNYIYNNYYVYNHSPNIAQPQFNQNINNIMMDININNKNGNDDKQIIELKDEDKREDSVNENPFRDDSNYNNNMNMNMNMNMNESVIKAKFNPFNYINDLCANNGHYVYNANVSC